MSTAQEIAQKAVDYVINSPQGELIGARLGALVKASFPDFTPLAFRAKNFRQFIRLYAPSLTEKPHSAGVDVLFALSESIPRESTTSESAPYRPTGFTKLPTDLTTWRAYSNPSNKSLIALNPVTHELKAVDPGAHVSSPWVLIPKPSSERHLELAQSFTATQQEHVRTALERILALPNWYIQFSAVAKRMNVGSAWASYRITKLSAELEAALLNFDTPLNALKFPKTPPSDEGGLVTTALKPESNLSSEAEVRKFAIAAVQHMPLSELRDLKISLGAILDALASK